MNISKSIRSYLRLNNMGIFKYTNLETLKFHEYQNIYIEKKSDNHLVLQIPKNYEKDNRLYGFQLKAESTIKDVLDLINTNNESLVDLKAFSLHKKEISNLTRISDLDGYNFYIISKDGKIFKANNED